LQPGEMLDIPACKCAQVTSSDPEAIGLAIQQRAAHARPMGAKANDFQVGSSADNFQVGGSHYKSDIQHWNYVLANDIPYLEAMVIKYLTRWRKKGGKEDVRKAYHFILKLAEAEAIDLSSPTAESGAEPGPGYVAQGGPDKE
jgi:hypothetical protein